MRLRVTSAAFAEIDLLLAYLAERSPSGAAKVSRTLQAAFATLLRHPDLGRRTSDPRLRRLTWPGLPYLIFYETTADEVIIIAVRHSARDPNTMPDR